jgi:hypothetical protein
MALILSGSDGLSDVDGSASTPAIRGTDTNTGIFFPAADTIAFAEGGAESMRLDSSGNLGLGTTNPLNRLHVDVDGVAVRVSRGSSTGYLYQSSTAGSADLTLQSVSGSVRLFCEGGSGGAIKFATEGTERMRINSSGALLVGVTSFSNGVDGKSIDSLVYGSSRSSTGSANHSEFRNPNGQVGTISTSGSSTTYSTSSDYRLKENIAPMTGALATVALLKPCTYTWKTDGADGQGFIAHELQAVIPDAVTGEKDAVDVDGNPIHQGIDTSFLVATLTAAIQELKAELDSVKAELATLKA